MKIKTDYVPEDVDYLTAGKEYEAEQLSEWLVSITDDSGEIIGVFLRGSSHTDEHPWTIIQDEPQFTQEQAREMYEELKEAVEWNWLGGDVPQAIENKCIGLLSKLESNDE